MDARPPVPLDYARAGFERQSRWLRVQRIGALVLIGWGMTYLVFAAFLIPAAAAEEEKHVVVMVASVFFALSVPELALGIWLHRRVRRRQGMGKRS